MSKPEQQLATPLPDQRFATTHWSVVLTAQGPGSPYATEALEKLCRTYWYPLYAYVRRRGHSVEDAQDLTQEFFAHLIEKHWLAEADRGKGRFRTFLLTALNHFIAKEWRRSRAVKRGGGRVLVSLDDTAEARYAQEAASNLTPEKIYDRRWALSLFDRALSRLREQYVAAGKTSLYDHLKGALSADPGEGGYARLGRELDLSPGAVAVAVHRLRQHYRQQVREEVAHTVDSPDDVEDEIRSLLAALH